MQNGISKRFCAPYRHPVLMVWAAICETWKNSSEFAGVRQPRSTDGFMTKGKAEALPQATFEKYKASPRPRRVSSSTHHLINQAFTPIKSSSQTLQSSKPYNILLQDVLHSCPRLPRPFRHRHARLHLRRVGMRQPKRSSRT